MSKNKNITEDIHEKIDFNPNGKTYYFRLDEHDCYKCASGKCSLEDISLDELKKYPTDCSQEKSINYCRGIASMLLNNKFPAPASINLNKGCGHYSFDDGQHRTCCLARLNTKGANIKKDINFKKEEGLCYYCGRLSSINKEIKLFNEQNVLYRIRNKKKLKQLLIEKENFSKKFHIWSL